MYTLYVARDVVFTHRHDLGSIICVRLINDYLPSSHFKIEEVSKAMKRSLPSWLTGTPTLHCDESDKVWRGYEAFIQLQEFAIAHASRRDAAPPLTTQKKKARPTSPAEPELEDVWTTTQTNDDEVEITGKLSAEDFRRAVGNPATQPNPPPNENRPPPSPIKD